MLKVANSVINASRITGVLPVANGGTGVTTSTGTGNTVLSASPTLSGDVNLSTGNLVIGTAGKGIDFSITSSGSGTMTSELLSDYEEGTWTPTQGSGLTVVGTFTSSGKYTLIGRQVVVRGSIGASTSIAATSGQIIFNNFPFAVSGLTVGYWTNDSVNVFGGLYASSDVAVNVTAITATPAIYFTVVYFTT
jgi:hypothetical protein